MSIGSAAQPSKAPRLIWRYLRHSRAHVRHELDITRHVAPGEGAQQGGSANGRGKPAIRASSMQPHCSHPSAVCICIQAVGEPSACCCAALFRGRDGVSICSCLRDDPSPKENGFVNGASLLRAKEGPVVPAKEQPAGTARAIVSQWVATQVRQAGRDAMLVGLRSIAVQPLLLHQLLPPAH